MAISFAADIKPLFSVAQVTCMKNRGVQLSVYAYMSDPTGDSVFGDHANVRHVFSRLSGTEGERMPLGGPYWTPGMLEKLEVWIQDGCLP